jgi:hypothetical protein
MDLLAGVGGGDPPPIGRDVEGAQPVATLCRAGDRSRQTQVVPAAHLDAVRGRRYGDQVTFWGDGLSANQG